MKIHVKFDFNVTSKAILQEQLAKLSIPHKIHSPGEVEVLKTLTTTEIVQLTNAFAHYGIEFLDEHKTTLVQRIKYTIDEMLEDDEAHVIKVSTYLADKLKYSYAHLSNLFSETTFTSIENFVILRKVDRAKKLLAEKDLTLTEIAYQLNYSSVAHLSGQFKKTTGLTPTTFQRIVEKRKKNSQQPV